MMTRTMMTRTKLSVHPSSEKLPPEQILENRNKTPGKKDIIDIFSYNLKSNQEKVFSFPT